MRPRLLFVYLQPSSFVREDLQILGEEYELSTFRFGGDGKLGPVEFAATLIKQFYWLLRELPRADGVFGWFVDYHMLLPALIARLLGKPVIVSVGGFDAISLPSLEYGIVLSRWRWPLARIVMRLADLLIPVSPSLVYSKNRFSEWPDEVEQGILAFMPDLETEIHVIPTGYDPELWPLGPLERQTIVSTVGNIDSDRTLRRKGIDLFIEAARLMPDVQFRIIGVQHPREVIERYDPPENVALIEPVRREALVEYYHESSVYVQLSRAEGLPNVLCEAMMCGCIPVGSRAFGIPDGVGEAGFVVDEPDPSKIAAAVRRALASGPERRNAARRHIFDNFHLHYRRRELTRLLSARLPGERKDRNPG